MVTKEDILKMKDMVRWFDPGVLITVLKPVIISGIFGKYADGRLVHAALDRTTEEEACLQADICKSLSAEKDGSVWLDYTADTGDGFNSTYAIAYSLAQPELTVDSVQTKRGNLVVFGGDQVYPDASYESYSSRFLTPFGWAFPDQKEIPDDKHPKAYIVPGNHDWYDGLRMFLGLFCRRTLGKIGNWRVPQRRSYFAVRLSDTWWLWGVDFALSESVDQPQADYFEAIAKKMPDHSKIIVCTATPGWLYGHTQSGKDHVTHPSFDNLGYCFNILKHAQKEFSIPLVLSGDTHHYSRYVAEKSGTHFVTAGGGGAFLHPTHQLKSKVKVWWSRANDVLSLATLNRKNTDIKDSAKANPACYPSMETSKQLLIGNFSFAFQNWKFAAILGGTYAILGLLAVMWNQLDSLISIISNPIVWAIIFLQIFIYKAYANDANWIRDGEPLFPKSSPHQRQWLLGLVHGLTHSLAIILSAKLAYWVVSSLFGVSFWTWGFNLSYVAFSVSFGGLLAGTIFGLYLYLTARYLGTNSNDAFSSLSMDSFKNFVRIKIDGEKLTLYPIGLDYVPIKSQWEPNPKAEADKTVSKVQPVQPLNYRLIEDPIEIM